MVKLREHPKCLAFLLDMDSDLEVVDPADPTAATAPPLHSDRHQHSPRVAPSPRSHRPQRHSGTLFLGRPVTGRTLALLTACLTGLGAAPLNTPTVAEGFVSLEAAAGLDGFLWTDTCNVYVLREGEAALLVDLGDGSVLDHLSEIGVTRIDWVLFTHHHREQGQGAPRLDAWRRKGTRVAAPEAERALFEEPMQFRKLQVSLDDAFTIHGSSFVRPPAQPIRLDRTFADAETFTWGRHEFRCVATPGNSPGGMTYVLSHQDRRLAFSGDVMLHGATLHTWYDTEWDYGFGVGIQALKQSVHTLDQLAPDLLLTSHGPGVAQPQSQLEEYGRKLEQLEQLYLRGYTVGEASIAHQDTVSTPTAIPDLVQVSPHLFKFRRPNFWPNFNLILADSGRALVVDCGLLDEASLDATLTGMQEHYGLKAIDAVVVTHMHGDHFLEAPYLRETWGAQIWTLDKVVDKMERPERFDYAAPVQAYGKRNPSGSPMNGVRVDRALQPGTSLNWEGFQFTVDWMPGQTEFALCLHGMIDGRLVAFTGDNLFGDPENPAHTGHEAVVAHNSAILEEGYILAAEVLHRLQPDRLVGGHSFVMDRPANLIDRYRSWAYAMRDAFRSLSSEEDYRIGFDPFWVRAEPYRLAAHPGDSAPVSLHLRNFRQTPQRHRVEIRTPAGWTAEPGVLEGEIEGGTRRAFPFTLQVAPDAEPGLRLVTFDVTLDGVRYGERFDMIVSVDSPRAPDSPRTRNE